MGGREGGRRLPDPAREVPPTAASRPQAASLPLHLSTYPTRRAAREARMAQAECSRRGDTPKGGGGGIPCASHKGGHEGTAASEPLGLLFLPLESDHVPARRRRQATGSERLSMCRVYKNLPLSPARQPAKCSGGGKGAMLCGNQTGTETLPTVMCRTSPRNQFAEEEGGPGFESRADSSSTPPFFLILSCCRHFNGSRC